MQISYEFLNITFSYAVLTDIRKNMDHHFCAIRDSVK